MKWFSIKGIKEEIRKIQWPSPKETSRNTMISIVFISFFVGYFMITEIIMVWALRLLGIGR